MNIFESVEESARWLSVEDRNTLLDSLGLDSEAPTSAVLKGSVDYVPRKMPSSKAIALHWGTTLVNLCKFESLWEVGSENLTTCWACGTQDGGTLHRAHILPRWRGGSDSVSNLHLLCAFCHETSENLFGIAYWNFFKSMNLFVRLRLMTAAHKLELQQLETSA